MQYVFIHVHQTVCTLTYISRGQLVQQLRDSMSIDSGGLQTIDLPTVLGRATLDSLGKAAFEYDFGALDQKQNALADSLHNFM